MSLGKITLCFKCADATYYAVKDYIENLKATDETNKCKRDIGYYEEIEKDINQRLKKWIKWGEVVIIEVDLASNMARVCENVGRD